ncbi:MAG: phosphopentomutase [Tenericutes bacterium HGW-Tenericutes-4]|nr:MAG: phosphopentomutase [Tenericutes bacterium HGW-Tenericutes-4]
MKVVLMVIDGFGIGEQPDAVHYGDEGSNTFLNTYKQHPMNIPNLEKLGLKSIDGVNLPTSYRILGNFARLRELSPGKDTTTGHLEMSGVVLERPFPTFEGGIPPHVMKLIEQTIGTSVIGGEAISGTEVIEKYGEEHLKTRKPIVYTSADSVIQVATHDRVYSVKELYTICKKLRDVMQGEFAVGRIIARPFNGTNATNFVRLPYRKDFSLDPPGLTMLSILEKRGLDVVAIGKIKDIFNGQGITRHIAAKNNEEAILGIKQAIQSNPNGLIFANLIDTDMVFGHRNDSKGYKEAIEKIDIELINIIKMLKEDDVVIITGDHGCDPTTPSTDHSREYTPLLIYGQKLKKGVNMGTLDGFNYIAKFILALFKIKQYSILDMLKE